MKDLVARVRRFIARHQLVPRGARVVVGVSGGSDSIALAHIVRELDAAGDLRIAGVAHFNHQLRAAADADEAFTATFAEQLGWRITVGREDVAARARRERRSVEDAGRTARHEFFERARTALGADFVALGHTRDDQAETFLLRLLRGAGPKGLAAMHPCRGSIVRPVLGCRRRELREYLADRHLSFVEDESNADLGIPRNRVRAELLPMLEQRFNPAIVDVLADEAELLREVWEWMEAAAGEWTIPTISRFDTDQLLAAPSAIRRLVLWKAMSEVAGGKPVSFDHVESALDLLRGSEARSLDLPGQTVERLPGSLVLSRRHADRRKGTKLHGANLFEYPLSIPGEVILPQVGCVVAAEAGPSGGPLVHFQGAPSSAAVVRRDLCPGTLRVRNRRPGDRFRPVGSPGRKKLQDYFVDRKVARHHRDAVPIVVDEQDRIVWVAGFGIDEVFRVTDPAQAVIILRLKLWGGSA